MGRETHEQFQIIFIEKPNRIIADERPLQGTIDHTPVYIRKAVKRVLELSSTALILVHNYPSGDPNRSNPDIEMTRKILEAVKTLIILIHDHVIVGREVAFSFRANGLIYNSPLLHQASSTVIRSPTSHFLGTLHYR